MSHAVESTMWSWRAPFRIAKGLPSEGVTVHVYAVLLDKSVAMQWNQRCVHIFFIKKFCIIAVIPFCTSEPPLQVFS